ncbi:MAG: rhodanese-like domain-containing protein [Cyclobacteriaceae bacterium]|nr:rhodanese-like domain-containing protein [Cyclobacteriaceae bacterium]
MKLLFTTVLLFVSIVLWVQAQEYVCMPCGQTCDNVVHNKPGTCSTCHMKLVLKSSLQFENLTADDFCKRIADNPEAILLDVRSKAEFEGRGMRNTYGHFNNAININIDELEKRLSELAAYKDREILVYCSHSVRSPRAAILLNNQGFKNVKNLDRGVSAINPNTACMKTNFKIHE